MADKPILFSAPMVRALLDGKKTQTRRVIKDRGYLPQFCAGCYDDKNDPSNYGWEDCERGEWITLNQFPRYRFVPCAVGDRLYVREHWKVGPAYDDLPPRDLGGEECILYLADKSEQKWGWDHPQAYGRHRQAMHMPRWASRLTLIVTDVRVQRLQEISTDDAIEEGISLPWVAGGTLAMMAQGIAKDGFKSLWNSINGPEAWDANPWVAAYSFRVIRANIDSKETAK